MTTTINRVTLAFGGVLILGISGCVSDNEPSTKKSNNTTWEVKSLSLQRASSEKLTLQYADSSLPEVYLDDQILVGEGAAGLPVSRTNVESECISPDRSYTPYRFQVSHHNTITVYELLSTAVLLKSLEKSEYRPICNFTLTFQNKLGDSHRISFKNVKILNTKIDNSIAGRALIPILFKNTATHSSLDIWQNIPADLWPNYSVGGDRKSSTHYKLDCEYLTGAMAAPIANTTFMSFKIEERKLDKNMVAAPSQKCIITSHDKSDMVVNFSMPFYLWEAPHTIEVKNQLTRNTGEALVGKLLIAHFLFTNNGDVVTTVELDKSQLINANFVMTAPDKKSFLGSEAKLKPTLSVRGKKIKVTKTHETFTVQPKESVFVKILAPEANKLCSKKSPVGLYFGIDKPFTLIAHTSYTQADGVETYPQLISVSEPYDLYTYFKKGNSKAIQVNPPLITKQIKPNCK